MSLTVFELVTSIKDILDNQPSFNQVEVTGEISNLSKYASGHWYFSLKDDSAKINAVMFSFKNRLVNFNPKDGDKVLVRGNVSVYVNNGQLQLVVNSMKPAGLGDLHAEFLKLKDKLYKEGYFDESHKKSLVKYPKKIAVIAGAGSAALADILRTLDSRWPMAQVEVFESLVQGSSAPDQLIFQLKRADASDADVILLARGGGSLEDLWAFNNENLVKAIYEAQTPVISGIGHEIDTTLVDYVADVRGLTPTAAAQLATPDQYEVMQLIDTQVTRIDSLIQKRLHREKERLNFISEKSVLKKSSMLIQPQHLRLQNIENMLVSKGRLFVSSQFHQIERLTAQLVTTQKSRLTTLNQLLSHFNEKLQILSPYSIMNKGYLLSYQDGRLIKSVSDIREDKLFELRYHDGKLLVRKVEDQDNE